MALRGRARRRAARRSRVGDSAADPGQRDGSDAEARPEDRLGAGPADAQPVRRPGRGGLHGLGDQLGSADQLQPEGPDPGAGDRQELGGLRRTGRRSRSSDPGHEVVGRQADHLGRRQVVAGDARRRTGSCSPSYTEQRHQDRHPGRPTRSSSTPSEPDARIIGGLFIYILPEHIWGKVPLKELTGQYQPELPLVGSGPYIVTEYQRGRIITMERNPNWRGRAGPTTRSSSSSTATRTRSSGPCSSARSTSSARSRLELRAPRQRGQRRDVPQPDARLHRARLQPLPGDKLPGRRSSTRRSRTGPCARRSPTRSTASKMNEIAARGTSYRRPTGSCPSYYKSFYEQPEQDYPLDPDRANQILDDAGWEMGGDGVREKDGETALVRPLRALRVAVQHPDGEADRGEDQGRSASSSTSRWSAPTSSTT